MPCAAGARPTLAVGGCGTRGAKGRKSTSVSVSWAVPGEVGRRRRAVLAMPTKTGLPPRPRICRAYLAEAVAGERHAADVEVVAGDRGRSSVTKRSLLVVK